MRKPRVTLAAVALAGLTALGGTATAASTTGAAGPSATPDTLSNSTIVNGYTANVGISMCLDARTDGTWNPNDDGDPVQLWLCNGGRQQNWTFHPVPGTEWGTITNSYSGKCLDAVTNSSINPADDGDGIQLWRCDGNAQQLWEPQLLNNGWYALYDGYPQSFLTLPYLVLDAENDGNGNPADNGDRAQLWEPGVGGTVTTNQQWLF